MHLYIAVKKDAERCLSVNHRQKVNLSTPNAKSFFFKGSSHAILLLHGFTGTPGHMRPIGEKLHQAGYTVQGMMLPGHGTHFEDMASCTKEVYISAVCNTISTLQNEYQKVTVAGLSMGGVLSLIAAEEMNVASIITLSAPMKTKNKFMSLAKILSPIKPIIYWRNNPKRKEQLDEKYDLGYTCFPTVSAYALHQLIAQCRKNLHKVHCPILVIQSHGDETISDDSLDIIVNRSMSTRKEKLWLNTAPHVCTLSNESPIIVNTITRFLNASDS